MKRAILFLTFMISALSAQAFDWSSLLYQQPQYQNYNTYQPNYETYPTITPLRPAMPVIPLQSADSSAEQTYSPIYCQYPQNHYYNPYSYQRPYYAYGNGLGNTIINPSGLGGTNGSGQIVRNVGRNMLYSMLGRY